MSNPKPVSIPGAKFIQAVEPVPGVVLLRLNRSPVNAFHEVFWRELGRTFDHLSSVGSVRAIVLGTALDKVFTAGLDITDSDALDNPREGVDTSRKAYLLHEHVREFQACISAIAVCHKPVIAAIHGLCLGLGVDITSACDVRLATSTAKFGIMEVNVGLAADIGTLQRFPKIVGSDSMARELALTGRMFDATEAEKIGFVSRVVNGGREEVEKEAVKMAALIASKSPIAVLGTKKVMNYSRDHSVQDGLEYMAAWNMAMLQSEDTILAFRNFVNKAPSPAKFKDLVIAEQPKVPAKL